MKVHFTSQFRDWLQGYQLYCNRQNNEESNINKQRFLFELTVVQNGYLLQVLAPDEAS